MKEKWLIEKKQTAEHIVFTFNNNVLHYMCGMG